MYEGGRKVFMQHIRQLVDNRTNTKGHISNVVYISADAAEDAQSGSYIGPVVEEQIPL